MTKPPRLDAPPANLRPLDRGTITKKIAVEPRVGPTAAQERAALLAKLDKDAADRLAKSAPAAPAPRADLNKVLDQMAKFAERTEAAARRIEAAERRIEAAKVEKSTPSLKTALAKADFAKKGR